MSYVNKNGRLERRDAGGEGAPSLREITTSIGDLAKVFADFRAANDERLAQIEKKGTADPVTEEKVTKLNGEITRLSTALQEMETRAARPGGAGSGGGERPELRAHRDAWVKWVRSGEGERSVNGLAVRANSAQTSADGAVLVPENVDQTILRMLRDESPLRGIFGQISVGTPDYKKLVATRGAASGWVGEIALRPETTGPQWTEVAAFMGEIYANPQVSQVLLDDSFVDLEAYLAQEIAYEFALREGIAFLLGSGTNQPKGILIYPTALTADATRAYGTFQHFVTGQAAALPTTAIATLDILINMIYSLKGGYRQNASWMMNTAVLASVRLLRNATDGNYYWQPPVQAGQPATLLGYPVTDVEDMPIVAAGNLVIGFGDWRRAYQIVDRMGIRSLRDPYTNKPYVGFYTTKRVGGMALDTQAAKFLKVSA